MVHSERSGRQRPSELAGRRRGSRTWTRREAGRPGAGGPPGEGEGGGRARAVPGGDGLPRLVIESSTDFAIIAVDPAGKVTSWNIGAERLLGWAAQEILGRDGDVTFTPEDRAAGAPEAERRDALARGRAEDERWHLRKDGSRFWGSGLLTPLADREAGFVKIMRDRTAQRRAEEAVHASEDRFRTALQIETVGVIFFDTEGAITEANDAFLRMS